MQVSVRVTSTNQPVHQFFSTESYNKALNDRAPSWFAYRVPKNEISERTKPVRTLVPSSVPAPNKATLAEIERRNAARLNSPLAMARGDLFEIIPSKAYSGEREPMIPRGEYRKNRPYKRKVIGVGKRVPSTGYCFDKKIGECREMPILSCEHHIVKYSTPRDPRKSKYKDLRCGQFRVKCLPLN